AALKAAIDPVTPRTMFMGEACLGLPVPSTLLTSRTPSFTNASPTLESVTNGRGESDPEQPLRGTGPALRYESGRRAGLRDHPTRSTHLHRSGFRDACHHRTAEGVPSDL